MLSCFFSSVLFMIRRAVVNDVDQQLCGVDDLALICTVNWSSYKSLSCPFLFCFPSFKKAFQLWWKFWILQETTIREDFVHSRYFDVVYLCYLFILSMRYQITSSEKKFDLDRINVIHIEGNQETLAWTWFFVLALQAAFISLSSNHPGFS